MINFRMKMLIKVLLGRLKRQNMRKDQACEKKSCLKKQNERRNGDV